MKFHNSKKAKDPDDPTRTLVTTTTTTFAMSRGWAKAICESILDARLFEYATDETSKTFKERSLFALAPKGINVLKRITAQHGIDTDHLAWVFSSRPTCSDLYYLPRRALDDELIMTPEVAISTFRRFVGQSANYIREYQEGRQKVDTVFEYRERERGMPLKDVHPHKYCFDSVTAVDWLCDFIAIRGRDEGSVVAAHFVMHGLVALVADKTTGKNDRIIFNVMGEPVAGVIPVRRPLQATSFVDSSEMRFLRAAGRIRGCFPREGDILHHRSGKAGRSVEHPRGSFQRFMVELR